jgi:hypothetical protein
MEDMTLNPKAVWIEGVVQWRVGSTYGSCGGESNCESRGYTIGTTEGANVIELVLMVPWIVLCDQLNAYQRR